ncbi:nuclease [Aureimonas altamirensis]|uniref:Nuclease n=1 Tax=Aureimonas altamirensis TaxID=370622 RepID=A0A0B1Q6W1_9HYPH|nr:thermonuclease family protein [Aureimonas altamirensis]KHJ55116.1 nuclease [Aureimonas altamirensis]
MQLQLSLLIIAAFTIGASAADISGRVTVIDGDTIAVEGTTERIRLYGIDAPEGQQTCETAAGERYLCGSNSAQFLADLIGRNGRVTCVEDTRDRYGRIVAECSKPDGTVINEAMVRGGWAVHSTRYSNGRYKAAEDHARSNRLGVWAGTFVTPERWRRGHRLPSEPSVGNDEGACQIKGNISRSGRIYHMPGSRAYPDVEIDLDAGERWFCTEKEAVAAGWRAVRG